MGLRFSLPQIMCKVVVLFSNVELLSRGCDRGHFLWTNLLLPRVLNAKGENARIVNVSSTGYVCSDALLDDYNFEVSRIAPIPQLAEVQLMLIAKFRMGKHMSHGLPTDPQRRQVCVIKSFYRRSRPSDSSSFLDVLFNTYLSSHLNTHGIDCFALQPGMPQTPLYAYTKDEGPTSLAYVGRLLEKRWGSNFPPIGGFKTDKKTLETSASTLIVALADERFDGKSGLFLKNCQVLDTSATPYVTDPSAAEKLWKLSESLVGEKFDI